MALLMKLEANPRQLREPDTKPLGNGLFEIRTMGQISPAESGYIRVVNVFFYFGSLSKIAKNAPAEIDQALRRLEEMQNEI